MAALDSAALEDELVLEGLVTTQTPSGEINVSPMGPVVERTFSRLRLRPFKTSRTFTNLLHGRRGVFHVTDDVEMFALAAIGNLTETPPLLDCEPHGGKILAGSCRWYAFEVEAIDASRERSEIACRVVSQGRLRDFIGWNRAQHAVLEAAILATRIHLTSRKEMLRELRRLGVVVRKTAGQAEDRAFRAVLDFVEGTSVESFAETDR